MVVVVFQSYYIMHSQTHVFILCCHVITPGHSLTTSVTFWCGQLTISILFIRGFILQEALTIIYGEDVRVVNVLYTTAPDISSIHTDEDSVDEDAGNLVDNLSGKQLWAILSAILPSGKRT